MIAVLLLLVATGININGCISVKTVEIGLLILNNLHRIVMIVMIFMFTCFAYDSAKHQLKKTDLSK